MALFPCNLEGEKGEGIEGVGVRIKPRQPEIETIILADEIAQKKREANDTAFELLRHSLIEEGNEGRIALVRGGKYIGIYDTQQDAIQFCLQTVDTTCYYSIYAIKK